MADAKIATHSDVQRHITIDPITRLEGHGKIDIFLNEAGQVERAYFQVPELRGFEKFVQGRPVEDMPQITSRICGVCPTAHHMAATKALDALYHVDPPPAAEEDPRACLLHLHGRRSRAALLLSRWARFRRRPGRACRRAQCSGRDRKSRSRNRQESHRHAPPLARADCPGRREGHPSGLRIAGRRGQTASLPRCRSNFRRSPRKRWTSPSSLCSYSKTSY